MKSAAVLLTALAIGCSGGGSVTADGGVDVRVAGDQGCLPSVAPLTLPSDASVPTRITADECSAVVGGSTLLVSTLNGEPCHVTVSYQDGGVALSTTVTWKRDSVCPDTYRLGDGGMFSVPDGVP